MFSMRTVDADNSMHVCVRHCPSTDITTWLQARDFAIYNNSRLCRYDIDPDDYKNQIWSSDVGPCPKLPIYKRSDWCNLLSVTLCLKVVACVHFAKSLDDKKYQLNNING